MLTTIKSKLYSFTAAACLLGAVSCKKDYQNPGAATADQVFNSPKGMMGAAVGIQRTFTLNVTYGVSNCTGLITGETFLLNPGNLSEAQFFQGGVAVDNTNALLGNIWSAAAKAIWDADNVIRASAQLADRGYAAGLVAYASIIKANAIGVQSMYWQQVPDTIGITNAPYIDRVAGFNKAVAVADRALAGVAANPLTASFLADMPAGLNIVNTLQALRARYALFAGNYTVALAAASAVDLSVRSTFNFDAANANPTFTAVTSTNNVYQPIDSTLGLPMAVRPALNDARVSFYTSINTAVAPRFRLSGFWVAATTAIPVYVNDEMRLIRAECLLRQSTPDVNGAKAIIDAILQQTPAQDMNGVGANIAAGYTGTVDVPGLLTEVYRNRCIELYHSGLKLEDMRRFGRPLTERKRNFFPYPFRERDTNTNTPADPSF